MMLGDDTGAPTQAAGWLSKLGRRVPHSVEAEVAILGAILVHNRAFEHVADVLRADHFALAEHRTIFDAARRLIEGGHIADPITLKTHFENSEQLAEVGGAAYLMRLAEAAVTPIRAGDYGLLLRDLYLRRELIALGEDVVTRAYDSEIEETAASQIERAMTAMAAMLGQANRGTHGTTTPAPDVPAAVEWPVLPPEFWAARTYLGAIRDWARWRCAAPDAVLSIALARAGVAARHAPATLVWSRGDRGDPIHPGLITIAVGPSGAGKTTAQQTAYALVPPDDDPTARWDLPIGSGEGVCEAYITEIDTPPPAGSPKGAKPTRERVQTVKRAMFVCDEAEAIVRLLARDGATLGATVRSAFSGQPLGAQNANRDRQRRVVGYTFSLAVCATPGAAAAIAAHAESGLPQRVIWAAAVDPAAPRHPPRTTAPTLPQLCGDIRFGAEILDGLDGDAHEIRTGRRTVAPMDQHLPIIRCRVAAILAAWDERAKVSAEDWALAGTIIETSCAVRDAALRAADSEQADERARLAQERGEIAQVCRAMSDHANEAVERMAVRLQRAVVAHGPMTRRELRDKCAKRYERHLLSPALALAMSRGGIAELDDQRLASPSTRQPKQ